MALDEAIASLLDVIDRITETTFALVGDLQIAIPETKTPKDIVKHASDFYNYVEKHRDLFPEAFSHRRLSGSNPAITLQISQIAIALPGDLPVIF